MENSDEEMWCQDTRAAKRDLGQPSAKKLFARLADLRAAENLFVLVHERKARYISGLKGKYAYLEGQYSLRLDGKRLVFQPDRDPAVGKETEEIDLRKVTSVKITFIGDYHYG